METLFNILPDLPPGFHYYTNFLTEEEEENLVSLIKSYPLKNVIFQGFEAKRKALSIGYNYHFDSRSISEGMPIASEFKSLLSKVADQLTIPEEDLLMMLLTEYDTGTVINWHRDAPPFEKIVGISLLSDCTFKLRPYDKSKQSRSATKSFIAERRSLYLMEGEARQEWEHSIAPVKKLRYSITIRTLRDKNKK